LGEKDNLFSYVPRRSIFTEIDAKINIYEYLFFKRPLEGGVDTPGGPMNVYISLVFACRKEQNEKSMHCRFTIDFIEFSCSTNS
jgi:hypothetical protein